MYDGRDQPQKIYTMHWKKLKQRNEDPLKIFNTAINNVKPNRMSF